MKIAYFDCFSGASGDMLLGSLIDAGLDPDALRRTVSALGRPDVTIACTRVRKNGISGTKVTIQSAEEPTHRHLSTIVKLIGDSTLPDVVKQKSIAVFENLARAEAKIHGADIEQVHFHEVGAVDAMVDIVGTVAALSQLGVEAVYSSPVNVGAGLLTCEHGTLPVPAPAALELLKGKPVYSSGTLAELLTPTGSALLSTLCTAFRPFVPLTVESIGYGAGDADHELPNLLRVTIGAASGC